MFDLLEGNVMCVFGEAFGLMVFEIVIDELVEKVGIDFVEFCILNDIQVDFVDLMCCFFCCQFIECLCIGVDKFGWKQCNVIFGQVCDGEWLVGYGVVVGFCNNLLEKLGVWVYFELNGIVIVEMDMIDIGIGSYIILVQMVVEMFGVLLEQVVVYFGDFSFLVFVGFGG